MIYTHLKSLLEDKTVVQIQIYGLGGLWNERHNGTGQLAVALKLFQKLKKDFPNLSITSQDPNAYPAEIEYQEERGIQFYTGDDFCAKRFTDILETENALKVQNPVMIFYAIHLPHPEFEKFLQAHWNPKLLSQIIFISNTFEPVYNYAFNYAKKAVEFSKFCTSIPLPHEPAPPLPLPKFNASKNRTHVSTFTQIESKFFAFFNTGIHTISYENAKKLINRCS
uniref:SRR1-like domain-containing protein n=1 Tax=Panagrolaimus davidi TaxID=227884 RepID=A0A914QNP1_9BILA